MILGTKILLDLVKKKKLVEHLSERELTNPEGAGFDFRLGEVFELSGKGFLGITERQTPEAKSVARFDPKKKSSFVFKPHKYYIVKTIEKLNVPDNLAVLFRARTTLFRSGVALYTGVADPGYSGELNFALVNHSGLEFEIELGARIVFALFYEVKGGVVSKYRGQWQGGRTSTKKREKQV